MENNYPDDEMLIKYLLEELGTEEEAFVAQWIVSDEHNRQYYEKLAKTWKITALKNTIDSIDVDDEWLHFKQRITESRLKGLYIQEHGTVEDVLTAEQVAGRTGLRKRFLSVAVAASVLLFIGIGWLYYSEKTPEAKTIVRTKEKPKKSILPLMHREVNTSGRPRTLVLQDGSEVVLEDKSEVSFLQPFTGNRRDITLQGKARFKVAKDKSRPFKVFSDAIATTVLGTVFDVTAKNGLNTITVKLYEGNVVVESVHGAKRKLSGSFYLLPGYELIFDRKRVSARVRRFDVSHAPSGERNGERTNNPDDPSIPANKRSSWFMFNNQPLHEVLEQLKAMYNVEIIYSKADVQKLYFIGEFNKADSFETILSQIARSNSLKLTKENNTFIISK